MSRWVVAAALPIALLVGVACSSGGDAGKETQPETPAADAGSDADPSALVPPVDAISMTEIAVGDFVFDARVAGPEDGEVVFLLHGFPQTSYEWRHQLRALARAGYRAIAPDQRGYSPRARPPAVADYGVLALAGDIAGMADAVGASRYHLVGHDWGAAVAWVVAVLDADRVITVNPISVPHPDAFAAMLADTTSCQYAASAYFDFFTTPEATDSFVANDFAFLRGAYQGVAPEDVEVYVESLGSREAIDAGLNWYRANVANRNLNAPALGKVTMPAMFTWSDGDTYLCREGGELTANYVDAPYRFEVVTGVNHWVPDLAPDLLNTLLLERIGEFSEKR